MMFAGMVRLSLALRAFGPVSFDVKLTSLHRNNAAPLPSYERDLFQLDEVGRLYSLNAFRGGEGRIVGIR